MVDPTVEIAMGVAEQAGKDMLEVMLNCLGVTSCKPSYAEAGWRNYYCTPLANNQWTYRWENLVGLGLARRGRILNKGKDRYYHVTEAGVDFVKAHLASQAETEKKNG